MNPDFQQAIEMTRSGDKIGAQKKVAELLKEDPNNAHAWYLLSLLVDSDQKRSVYLSKVVSLDPNHEKAIEQLTLLQQATTSDIPISADTTMDLMDQEKAETIPDWMAEAGVSTMDTETSILIEDEVPEEDDIPDWVQEDVSTSWIEEDDSADIQTTAKEVVAQKQTPPPQKKKKAPAKTSNKAAAAKRKKQAQQLNLALGGLVILAILVFFLIIYMLLL